MGRRTILIALSLAALILAAANFSVGHAARNSVPRQTMRNINTAGPVIGVLGLGNSLMAAGFDAAAVQETFQKAGQSIVAVNAGLGSTSIIEHLALMRLALQHHAVREVVYGFFDQQMSPEMPLRNSDLLGNYAMLYYQEPELALRYGQFSWLERIEFQTYRCCALLRERSNIWAKVEKLRRAMQEVGMPRQETNQFGRRADFDLLEAGSPDLFAEQCRTVMRSGDFLAPAVQEFFKEAHAYGSRVTVVEMPMSPLHVRRFYDLDIWKQFRIQNRLAIERAGASYVDASHWLPDDGAFQDHVHLGRSGAAEFSRRLAEELLRRRSMPQ